MNGPKHYLEAEWMISRAETAEEIAIAQVHATLALAAATAAALDDDLVVSQAWSEATR